MVYLGFFEKKIIPTYDDPRQVRCGEVVIDYNRCNGCWLCIKLCPADALENKDNKPVLKKPGENECMGCADCAAFCPESAICLTKGFQCETGRYKSLDQGELFLPRL
jgi:ferredoxin